VDDRDSTHSRREAGTPVTAKKRGYFVTDPLSPVLIHRSDFTLTFNKPVGKNNGVIRLFLHVRRDFA